MPFHAAGPGGGNIPIIVVELFLIVDSYANARAIVFSGVPVNLWRTCYGVIRIRVACTLRIWCRPDAGGMA